MLKLWQDFSQQPTFARDRKNDDSLRGIVEVIFAEMKETRASSTQSYSKIQTNAPITAPRQQKSGVIVITTVIEVYSKAARSNFTHKMTDCAAVKAY